MLSRENKYCVIMAGGIGSRFWPMSRNDNPKQFIDILNVGSTLLQGTYKRARKIVPPQNIFVVTNEKYASTIKAQLAELPSENILLEPSRRDTAPCIAYSSFKIINQNPNAVCFVVPSDHYIVHEDRFVQEIQYALEKAANHNILITLGVKPTKPETGYGYIQYSEDQTFEKIKKVKTFAEKPNLELAIQFLKSGDFLWNSGIFIWTAKAIIEAFKIHQEEMALLFSKENENWNTDKEKEAVVRIYNVCKSISVDYGILEKAQNVYVIPVDFGWSDLGTWGSLYEASAKTDQGNAIFNSNIITSDTKNCIIKTSKEKLFVIQGLNGFIVAENDGLVLICPLEKEQEIKALVNQIRIEKGEKFL